MALASLSLQTREFSLAIEATQKALQIQPHHTQAQLLLGRAYLGNGEGAKALTTFQAATDHSPQDPAGYYYLALGYRAQKQEGQALQPSRRPCRSIPTWSTRYRRW